MSGRNIEIKARLRDPGEARAVAASISDSGPAEILQEDTYFRCRDGRLKLRKFSDSEGELIHYNRPNRPEPVACEYSILEISDPDELVTLFAKALGIRGIVKKKRTLYLAGQTRIHIDEVEGLGDFLEIEVVLEAGQSGEDGEGIARSIMKQLGIRVEDLLDYAYIDMIS